MTLIELYERIGEMLEDSRAPKDFEVQIDAMTGRLTNDCNIAIKDICFGFDWDSKRVLIRPAECLVSGELYQREKEKGRMVGAARGADDESHTDSNH